MITILATIVVLGVLIFVHELGHFLAAKISGVVVERFSIGFPPILFRKKIGETEYSIGIPYGGFVKMRGDEADFEPSEGSTPDPKSFYGKGIIPRAFILAGGVIMNILLALLIFFMIFAIWGVPVAVKDSSPVVGEVGVMTPAEDLGLVTGDTILAIDGTYITKWNDMTKLIHPKPEQVVTITWLHEADTITDSIMTMAMVSGDTSVGMIGIMPYTINERIPVLKAAKYSVQQSVGVLGQMIDMIYRLFHGNMNSNEVGGPVLIAKLAGSAARKGIPDYLSFLALISINLAFINMLPLPALDGGQMMFLIIEAIRKKRLPMKARIIIQNIGFLFIIGLIILITTNDVMRLFK